ncbi:MAG: hypothetical protein ACK2UB_10715 [Anaerolineales bacterium]
MITIFTTTKASKGAVSLSQRNTFSCWKRLVPACEILLISEEEGSAELAREFGLRLVPEVERNESRTPTIRSLIGTAEAHATYPLLLLVNSDILFDNSLLRTARAVSGWRKPFLLFGRRWDVDMPEAFDFSPPEWEERLAAYAKTHGKAGIKSALDYFLFPKGAWGGAEGLAEFPPAVIGRPAWDNWIVFWALARRMDTIHGSDFIRAYHQNHDYSFYPTGRAGIHKGDEGQRNYALLSYERYLYGTPDARYRIRPDGKIVRSISADILRRRLKTYPDLWKVWIFGRKRWRPS